MRFSLLLSLALLPGLLRAQSPDSGSATALGFTRSMSFPLNALQLYDQALDAWNWTFGKEPGAKILHADRDAGVLEGSARMNFRSKMLTGREESMGTIAYHVQLQVRAGECRAVVSSLTHTGNRTTTRGGIHLGQLMRNDADAKASTGMGLSNTIRLHAELRETSTARMNALLQSMEARIRARLDP